MEICQRVLTSHPQYLLNCMNQFHYAADVIMPALERLDAKSLNLVSSGEVASTFFNSFRSLKSISRILKKTRIIFGESYATQNMDWWVLTQLKAAERHGRKDLFGELGSENAKLAFLASLTRMTLAWKFSQRRSSRRRRSTRSRNWILNLHFAMDMLNRLPVLRYRLTECLCAKASVLGDKIWYAK